MAREVTVSGLWVRIVTAAAGLTLTVGVATACGSSDSTVTAPSSSDAPVSSSAPSSSSGSSSAPSSGVASSDSSLPATAPQDTPAPSNFPGGAAPAPQGSKGAAYLAELKRQNVTIPNDPDNSIALSSAEYVCSERAKNSPAAQIRTLVTAIVGSGTTDAAAASATADKVIAAATSTYCK